MTKTKAIMVMERQYYSAGHDATHLDLRTVNVYLLKSLLAKWVVLGC